MTDTPLPAALPFQVIGLTGGIATGKSTVSRLLLAAGLPVIDADKLARQVVEPGTEGLAAIVEAFGPEVLRADGALDRPALGARVFADAEARARLNAITHPRIAQLAASALDALQREGAPLAVYDMPLLVENGLHAGMDLVVVVALDRATQMARLAARDGLGDEAIAQRLAAQLPQEARLAVADVVIDNSGPPEATTRQVEALIGALPSRLWPDRPDAAAAFERWRQGRAVAVAPSPSPAPAPDPTAPPGAPAPETP